MKGTCARHNESEPRERRRSPRDGGCIAGWVDLDTFRRVSTSGGDKLRYILRTCYMAGSSIYRRPGTPSPHYQI